MYTYNFCKFYLNDNSRAVLMLQFFQESDQNGHEDSDGEIDIRSPSPLVNSGPFKHLYDVKVPTAVKDGDNLKFTITVCDVRSRIERNIVHYCKF